MLKREQWEDANILSLSFVLETATFPIAKNIIAEPKELIRTIQRSLLNPLECL
jgi:hypothetical protein